MDKKRKRSTEDEEAAFPRGGASILTPLEHKQIQIEATQDVLFEQQNSKFAKVIGHSSDSKRRKTKRILGEGIKKTPIEIADDESVKIEGLNYKRLVTGSLVLGQVSQVNEHDLALALPNNLTGFVPITSISDKFTQRIEAVAIKEGDVNEEEYLLDEISMGKIYKIGQYLRAQVVSTSDESKSNFLGKPRRRIELSIRPQNSNHGIAPQNIIMHSTIMASVASVEDYGVIMDLGIEDSSMRGFISSKELGKERRLSDIQEGSTFLCIVTGLSSNGKTVKLSADPQKIGNTKKSNYLSEAPTIDLFLPGTAVEVLITEITTWGLAGKLMGMVDVTADLIHSGAGICGKALENKYKIGSKVKGRLICTFPGADPHKLGISFLDQVVSFTSKQTTNNGESKNPLEILPLSSIIDKVTVTKVEAEIGLFVDVGVKGVPGFVHISRVKDGKIDRLSESGSYKLGSTHQGRLIGYNSIDGIYILSLETSVIEQPFLRVEDLKIGVSVQGKIEKLVLNTDGVGGLLVNLAEGITGLVPEAHMSDTKLLHPERKFKQGITVNARILSTNPKKRQVRLTLKKSLVNSDATQFLNYEEIEPGMQSPGTIINIIPSGAVVQFYGDVRGFLPVAEMSEAYIQDPKHYFRIGQVVNVHVLNVDSDSERMTVSCKDPSSFGLAQQHGLKNLKIGEIVSGLVVEKSDEEVQVILEGSGLRALLQAGQLTDGSSSKNASSLKKIRVGATLTDLAVLEKVERKRLVILTNKPSLVKDARDGVLLRSFEDVRKDCIVHGFVRNISPVGVFIQFGGGLTGLLPKARLSEDAIHLPDFGMKKFQSLTVKIVSIDHDQERFQVSLKDLCTNVRINEQYPTSETIAEVALRPVDETIATLNDLTLGRCTKARVASVKDTQINVQLADNIQGRIDISQVFDSWEAIKDRKRPLKLFSSKQIIDVRILGTHDARNHRFLPITHRGNKTIVFELSAKPSDQTNMPHEILTLDKIKVGSSWISFINNVSDNCLWVNLSPNIRGRIEILDVSDDVSLLEDLELNFPVGSALRVHVTNIDAANNRLDLSARPKDSRCLDFSSISKGMIVPAKVIKVDERHILLEIGPGIIGQAQLTDLADDFTQADPKKYTKNSIARVCVCEIDASNKKIRLSTRPSRVLNSSLPVQDPEISSLQQVKVNDIARGFVKNITDKGLFINLGGNVVAYVRVSDLSDSFIKDWQSQFKVGQLVKGKVVVVNPALKQVQMSLKASILDQDFVPPLAFGDLKVGQVITGKVRKVEDYGIFIVVDGSNNLSGLCHHSQLAEKRVQDVKKLYQEGDSVKAIILRLDAEKRRVSFGLKSSYLEKNAESEEDTEDGDSDSMNGDEFGEADTEDGISSQADNDGVRLDDIKSIGNAIEAYGKNSDKYIIEVEGTTDVAALKLGGFDWSAAALGQVDDGMDEASELSEFEQRQKKKRIKAGIAVDKTGDLDLNGPQSDSDFERLLLGQPDSSRLWIQYMAFQMQLGELGRAREVAERALRTINIREETEKLNMWIALLNLESTYGNDETVDEVFKRACQYNDAQEVHERLTSIYIQSGKHDKADESFQVLVKKFSQTPSIWYNYAHFLHTTLASPDRARILLPRAIQSLPTHTHLNITLKFASLEFHSPSGSPERGRTIFEGLLSTFPKRLDIWNQLLDLEVKQGDRDIIRGVFERVVKTSGLKPKGAKAWFRRWSEWEEKNGDGLSCERVRARAEEWVRATAQRKSQDDGKR